MNVRLIIVVLQFEMNQDPRHLLFQRIHPLFGQGGAEEASAPFVVHRLPFRRPRLALRAAFSAIAMI
jgi:hypothetical protein